MTVGTGAGQSHGFDTVVSIRHIGTMHDEQIDPMLVMVGQCVFIEVGVGWTVGIGDSVHRSSMAAANPPLFYISSVPRELLIVAYVM